MTEVELFDWSHIRDCINTHHAITGQKPLEIVLPFPKDFKVFGVSVKFHGITDTVTCGADRAIYHKRADKKSTP